VLVEGFPVSLGVIVGIIAAVTCAFALSLPMLHSPIDSAMLGGPKHAHHSVAQVRHVFRDYGVSLHYTSRPHAGLTVLGVLPPPYAETGLYVAVRSGSVDAHYGGANALVRRRVQAAVAALTS
jgi:hypothetical protein